MKETKKKRVSKKVILKEKDNNTKRVSGKKNSGMKTEDSEENNYCKACLKIYEGTYNFSGISETKYSPHTCKKSAKEINEIIYHMNIINRIRRGAQYVYYYD